LERVAIGRCTMMTSYDLFHKIYVHYYGQFLMHLYGNSKVDVTPKEYVQEAFLEALQEYSIQYVSSTALILVYDDPTNKMAYNTALLQSIDVMSGYWLCSYSGHTGDWQILCYDSRSEAKASYKEQYIKYFKHQEWYYILRVHPV